MTTIATDGKVMAGDGQTETSGSIVCRSLAKVTKLPDGSIVGCAGETSRCRAFAQWLAGGGSRPKTRRMTALRLMPDGTALYYADEAEPVPIDVPCAIGSGAPFAMGAMDAGADPALAVIIAMGRDPSTGGSVTVVKL